MEWTRQGLKSDAKEFLRTRYWYAFLVSVITGILAGGGGGFSGLSNTGFGFGQDDSPLNIAPALLIVILALAVLGLLFSVAFAIFVSGPVRIGAFRWFIRGREGEEPGRIATMFAMFRKGSYRGAVSGYAWMQLWLFLWMLPYVAAMATGGVLLGIAGGGFDGPAPLSSFAGADIVLLGIAVLCFVAALGLMIPAVIKSYAYRLTPWILADNPRIGFRRALRLSIAMTRNQKMDIFVLDLSFLGWYLLGLLACCIGTVFVTPYVMATQSELYAVLKKAAVERGDCSMEDLGYVKDEAPSLSGS